MPLLPLRPSLHDETIATTDQTDVSSRDRNLRERTGNQIRVRNRRKRYLDTHPDYFSSSDGTLELADPLLYDRLVRRFQSAAEREAAGKRQGNAHVLEASLLRSEAKVEALANPDPNIPLNYRRGPNGEIIAEDPDEIPANKEEGFAQWKKIMELRFLRGDDHDFDYTSVDENEEYDDLAEEQREAEESYFDDEEPSWNVDQTIGGKRTGETGIQDF